MSEDAKIKLLVNISRMYYEYNYSQLEISKKVGLSRTYIGKLLVEAKNRGIVEIRIRDPLTNESDLEERLRKKFGLKKAIVIPADDSDPIMTDKLGEAAAQYMNAIIKDNDIIGVSWGATLHAFSKCVQPRSDLNNIHVVQLCGGISQIERNVYTSEIPQNIAKALNGECHLIPLPAVLDSVATKNAVIKDRSIIQSMDFARQATVAVFTVGVFGEFSAFVRAGYFSEEELQKLKSNGAVGDICSHIINSEGKLCDLSIEKRTVAVSFEGILAIPTRIGIAADLHKYQCIKAALQSSCFNIFVTNEMMAQELLKNI